MSLSSKWECLVVVLATDHERLRRIMDWLVRHRHRFRSYRLESRGCEEIELLVLGRDMGRIRRELAAEPIPEISLAPDKANPAPTGFGRGVGPDYIVAERPDLLWQVNWHGRRVLVGDRAQLLGYFDPMVGSEPLIKVWARAQSAFYVSPLGLVTRLESVPNTQHW